MQTSSRSKLEGFLFADLIVTVIVAVLAYGTVEPWSLALFELNALFVAVLLAVRFVTDSEANWRRLRIALPVLALMAFAAIQSATFSLDPQGTREATVKLLALVIYFLAALHTLRDAERRQRVLLVLTIFGFAVSLFAIAQRLTYNGKMYWIRPVSAYIAPYGPYGNYNHFAGMVELILPLPLAYLLFARIDLEKRLLWLFSVVMMGVAVLLSLSRGGALALGIEVLVLLGIAFVSNKGEAQRVPMATRMLIAVALAATLSLALWIGYEPLLKRLGTVGQGASEHSFVTRTEYWRASWQMFLDHKLSGVGLGAFPAVYPSYGRSSAKLERLEQAHNDYLQLLTDAGLIGGLLGLWFLFELVRVTRKQWVHLPHSRTQAKTFVFGGLTALLGIGVHSLMDFNLQIAANALLFFLVVALTTSVELKPTHKSEKEF